MPEYRLSLDFTAADDAQAERLAEAWAGTCAAEYGTRMVGLDRIADHPYLSTACQHQRHGDCRHVCKFCPALCGCTCHHKTAPMCVTLGHEQVPATTVGTYDDGLNVFPGTAYCASCAELMTRAGDWTADRTATGTYPLFTKGDE